LQTSTAAISVALQQHLQLTEKTIERQRSPLPQGGGLSAQQTQNPEEIS